MFTYTDYEGIFHQISLLVRGPILRLVERIFQKDLSGNISINEIQPLVPTIILSEIISEYSDHKSEIQTQYIRRVDVLDYDFGNECASPSVIERQREIWKKTVKEKLIMAYETDRANSVKRTARSADNNVFFSTPTGIATYLTTHFSKDRLVKNENICNKIYLNSGYVLVEEQCLRYFIEKSYGIDSRKITQLEYNQILNGMVDIEQLFESKQESNQLCFRKEGI